MEFDMKKIIPCKLVVSFASDGTVVSALLQYKTETDGAMRNEFNTMSVDTAISKGLLESILTTSKLHVEKGEKINESKP
jgi:hypothetical protein